MENFEDKVLAAENAMRKRKAKPKGAGDKLGLQKSADRSIEINGVEVATKKWADAEHEKIRADMNEILDNFDGGGARTLVLEDSSGKVIGEVEGRQHYQLKELLKACNVVDRKGGRKNIMLKGELGGGKSTAGEQVAEAFGLDFTYLGQTEMPHDVIGYCNQVSGKYIWTPYTKAFVYGGVCMLEEMDSWSARATLVANPSLASGMIMLPDGEMHKRHKDCIIIACTNTWGNGATAEYVGRNRLDSAFLDRFGIKIDWKYDLELEKVAGNLDVVRVVQQARYNAAQNGLRVVISPRSSFDISDMVRAGFSIREGCELNFLSGLDRDQRKLVMDGTDV